VPIGVAGAVTLGAAALGAGATVYAADKNANTMKSSMSQSPELTGATNSALAQGEQIAQRTYTPYEAQRYAGLSPNEQVASGLAQTGGTKAQSFLDKAGNELSGIKDYSSENLRPYIDPYVSSVLTPELEQENIRYEGARSALANSKAGAFGGDRSALEATGMERTHGKQIAADVGNVYSAAYTNAQHAFFQDQDKKINAANALDKVGGDVSRLNTQQIQDLMATGGLERALSQAQLDFNYQQFIENRDWSTTNLTPLLNSIAAAKGAQMTTTTTGPQSGIAGEAIGAAATIAGAYFTGGKSTSPDQQTLRENWGSGNYGGTPQAVDPGSLSTPYDPSTIAPGDYSSDPRLKFDREIIGMLRSGLPWWRFRYLSSPHQVREGVMADEVRLVFPEAVRPDEHGFLRVDYARIH